MIRVSSKTRKTTLASLAKQFFNFAVPWRAAHWFFGHGTQRQHA